MERAQTIFRIAVQASIWGLDSPAKREWQLCDRVWFVIARRGEGGEHLFLHDTGIAIHDPLPAFSGLVMRRTAYAGLVRESEECSEFLFDFNPEPDATRDGEQIHLDGYARLVRADSGLDLYCLLRRTSQNPVRHEPAVSFEQRFTRIEGHEYAWESAVFVS